MVSWHTRVIGEDARAFLQQRVALVGRVVLLISGGGIVAQAVVWPLEEWTRPAFLLLVVGAVFPALQWLLCRGAVRSPRVLRAAEAVGLMGTAVCVAVSCRFIVATIMLRHYGAITNHAGSSALYIATLFHIVASVGMGLGFIAVLRAALIPSRPAYTAAFTAALGVPLVIAAALGPEPFGWVPPLPIDATPTGEKAWHAAAVWWVFATIVCTAITDVIYGLRKEVARAKQLGQYTLEAKIGEGGMGMVYRARHALLQRPTAVKLLSPGGASQAQLARFEREVQLTTRLTHPNTITIYDYGRTPDGVFYYAMELLDGASLKEVIEADGAQPPERVVSILKQVAGALEEAHDNDLIHRDIKPGNIILCSRVGSQMSPSCSTSGLSSRWPATTRP
jgi:hypothetical protein